MAEKTSRLGKIKAIQVPYEYSKANGAKTTVRVVVEREQYGVINRHSEAVKEFVSYTTTAIVVGDSDSPMPGWFIVYGKRAGGSEIDNPEMVLAAFNPEHVVSVDFFLEGE